MKILLLLVSTLILSVSLLANQPASLGKFLSKQISILQEDEQILVLITFTDKGNLQKYKSAKPESFLSSRAIKRRSKVRAGSSVVDQFDYPLERQYVQAISGNIVTVRHELKWFNAVSAIATKKQIGEIQKLPFVKEIELVGKWKRNGSIEEPVPDDEQPATSTPGKTATLDYGPALKQLSQMNVPAVHNLGIYGQGVMIGVFDNGFRLLTHQAFSTMNIVAQYDFVDHKVSVIPNNTSTGFGAHGVNTLSTIGGYMPAQLIGPAFKSAFVLGRTENDSSETPVEEDNWAKAIEWADSIGIDVASTSLGYFTYDAPYTSWTWQDMDGHSSLITKAADRAVGLGIVVVNSAGNDASRGTPNTLIAPADGDSVISAGAVDSLGTKASFSSYGPTFDGRIKPDIMAMGVAVRVASATNPSGYSRVNGTSFSCPLSAGVAALILCANPSLTPMQVRDAMRNTANNAGSPNNLYGWGIINALNAVNYFGIFPSARIGGTVFTDLNNDGVKDFGETGIPGRKVYLSGTAADSAVTDSLGSYLFDSLALGSYTVTQETPAGWVSTYPFSGSHTLSVDSVFQNISGKDFGGYILSSISGIVYNDLDSNSIKDLGEPPLENRKIMLSGNASSSVYSDSQGEYSFNNLSSGTYTVSESLFWGWIQTAPVNQHTVLLPSGVDTAGFDFGNYYSPMVGYPVSQGWNLLSLPITPVNSEFLTVYPTAASAPFIYNNGYQSADTLRTGIGYWIKFGSNQGFQLNGDARINDTLNLTKGWHIIGTLTFPVALTNVIEIPDTLISSNYYYYDGTYQTAADSLYPHKGYWVKASVDGQLILNTSYQNSHAPKFSGNIFSADNFNSLTIRDQRGSKQLLYFGNDKSLSGQLAKFELPPPAPDNILDARFSTGTSVGLNNDNDILKIHLKDGTYPLTLSWNMVEKEKTYILSSEKLYGLNIKLTGKGSITLSDPRITALTLNPSNTTVQILPESFELKENYPNPFNPSTTIAYTLPSDAFVKIQIFNLIGQHIADVVSTTQPAGHYTAVWNAISSVKTELPGGIYLCRFEANPLDGTKPFSQIRKMALIK